MDYSNLSAYAVQATNAILNCAATRSALRHDRPWQVVSFEVALEECEKAHKDIQQRLVKQQGALQHLHHLEHDNYDDYD